MHLQGSPAATWHGGPAGVVHPTPCLEVIHSPPPPHQMGRACGLAPVKMGRQRTLLFLCLGMSSSVPGSPGPLPAAPRAGIVWGPQAGSALLSQGQQSGRGMDPKWARRWDKF